MKNSAKPFEIGLHTAHSKNLLSESLLKWGKKAKFETLLLLSASKQITYIRYIHLLVLKSEGIQNFFYRLN